MAEALAQSRAQRLYESVLLRTLGATRGRVARAFAVEYGCLGLVAGLGGGGDRRPHGVGRPALRPRRAAGARGGARRRGPPGQRRARRLGGLPGHVPPARPEAAPGPAGRVVAPRRRGVGLRPGRAARLSAPRTGSTGPPEHDREEDEIAVTYEELERRPRSIVYPRVAPGPDRRPRPARGRPGTIGGGRRRAAPRARPSGSIMTEPDAATSANTRGPPGSRAEEHR